MGESIARGLGNVLDGTIGFDYIRLSLEVVFSKVDDIDHAEKGSRQQQIGEPSRIA
jgi:hypothetical protein